MTFEKPPTKEGISRREIDRAGDVLINKNSTSGQLEKARRVLNRWRASHSYPINTFQSTLRAKTRGGSFGKNVIIAQRLKRAPTIIEKLREMAKYNVKLLNMQDIAGVRAILPSIRDVRKLEKEYKKVGRFEHILNPRSENYDYISTPKQKDGYRSLHLIYKYKNKKHPYWDDLWVELQIRTMLQHSWATAVETVHNFFGKAIKTRQGQDSDQKWTEFFRLVSAAFSIIEKTPIVECYKDLSPQQILEEIRKYEKELKVITKLKTLPDAIKIIYEHERNKTRHSHFHLIVLNTGDKSKIEVNMYSFGRNESKKANLAYEQKEAEAIGKDYLESVLVSANEINEAYSSFFANTKDFTDSLGKVLSGGWVKEAV